MDRKIIVAGAGHGGIVAAYYLALEDLSRPTPCISTVSNSPEFPYPRIIRL